MADTKVSSLAAASLPLDGTEVLPVVQSGTSKKVTVAGLLGWTEHEIDFGSTPQWSKSFTVTDSAVATTSHVVVTPSGKTATGRTGDDWAWDGIVLSAVPATGSFTLTALALPGPVVGKRTVQYQVG